MVSVLRKDLQYMISFSQELLDTHLAWYRGFDRNLHRKHLDLNWAAVGRFSNFFQKGFQNPTGLDPSSLTTSGSR